MHRPPGFDVLIIPNELSLFPHITDKAVNGLPAEVGSAVEPVRAEYPDVEVDGAAAAIAVEGVVEGGAISPLEVVQQLAQLVLDDVEVAGVGPVVPEVDEREGAAIIGVEEGVELRRPWRRGRRRALSAPSCCWYCRGRWRRTSGGDGK